MGDKMYWLEIAHCCLKVLHDCGPLNQTELMKEIQAAEFSLHS